MCLGSWIQLGAFRKRSERILLLKTVTIRLVKLLTQSIFSRSFIRTSSPDFVPLVSKDSSQAPASYRRVTCCQVCWAIGFAVETCVPPNVAWINLKNKLDTLTLDLEDLNRRCVWKLISPTAVVKTPWQ